MFARCSVTLSMPYPVDGMVAVHLFKGTLLRPVHPGYPWFCLVEEVKLGLSGTHITDAECVDFGANGNIPALTLVEVAGYPGIRVTNSRAAGGQDAPYGVLDSVQVPSRESAALAVVSKDPRIALGDRTDIATLIRAIDGAASGLVVMDPSVVERLGQRDSRLGALTKRQLEVLSLMAKGYNNAAIARALVLEEKSVENHINAIFGQLSLSRDNSAHPRVKAVLLYLQETPEEAPEQPEPAPAPVARKAA